jgi:hypothetical protein
MLTHFRNTAYSIAVLLIEPSGMAKIFVRKEHNIWPARMCACVLITVKCVTNKGSSKDVNCVRITKQYAVYRAAYL